MVYEKIAKQSVNLKRFEKKSKYSIMSQNVSWCLSLSYLISIVKKGSTQGHKRTWTQKPDISFHLSKFIDQFKSERVFWGDFH